MRQIEFENREGVTVWIEQDVDAGENPRDWDNAGRMVCFHGRYRLGDDHDFTEPDEFTAWSKRQKGAVVLPLYLYDHGGLRISMGPFSCPWDSGQVGWIYMLAGTIKKEFDGDKIKAVRSLRGEVSTYDQYLSGDVYFYSVKGSDGEVLDSCGGLYGWQYAEEAALEAARYCVKDIRKAKADALKADREARRLGWDTVPAL